MVNLTDSDVSPVPQKKEEPKGMSFFEALKKILEGQKVTRPQWEKDDYGYLGKDDILYIHRDGKDYQWMLHKTDMELEDYTLVLVN